MTDWAEWWFRKSRKQDDGGTEADHQASAAEQWAKLGRHDLAKAAQPDEPPFPDVLGYVWEWFQENSRGMSSGGMSYPTITWESLAAWSALMRVPLEPWEASLILTLGNKRANIMSEKLKTAE